VEVAICEGTPLGCTWLGNMREGVRILKLFIPCILNHYFHLSTNYTGGADKSLARPGRKQATATEGFDFHIS
jgi:hypothetical protein